MSSKEHGVNVIDFIKVVDFNLPVLKTGGFPPPFSRNIRNATSFDSAQAKKPLRHWSVQIIYDLAVGTVLPLKFLGEKGGFCSQLSF